MEALTPCLRVTNSLSLSLLSLSLSLSPLFLSRSDSSEELCCDRPSAASHVGQGEGAVALSRPAVERTPVGARV